MMLLDVLETLVGFVTVVLLLSVVVTAMTQATQALLRLRGRNLRRGLELLLCQAIAATQEGGDEKPVGLLVVHGIGEQKEGSTRDSVVRGLRKAYPEARFENHPDHADMIYQGRRVRIYEVYWAPVLMDERVHGSFSIQSIYEFVWFPSFNNAEAGSVHQDDYEPALVKRWHRTLVPLGMFAGSIYHAITMPLRGAGWATSWLLRRSPGHRVKPQAVVDNWLAERIGDVFNYVNAYAGIRDRSPVPDAPMEIYEIFREKLEMAARDCSEVQILSHSMGTVIVHHALTDFADQTRELVTFSEVEDNPGRPHLTRIYTIGSPLEKIRFFWPKVALEKTYNGKFEWHNFQSRADVVAGTLKLYRASDDNDVQNHRIRGAGGLITAHNGYRSHPTFLKIFGRELTSVETPIQPHDRWRWLQSLYNHLETAVATAALFALSFVGAAIFFAAGYFGVRLTRWYFEEKIDSWSWLVLDAGAIAFGFVLILLAIVMPLISAKKSAQEVHTNHWLTVTDQDGIANRESAGT